MTAANKAMPNPSILKESPISSAVSDKSAALITMRNNPKEMIVTGSVKMTSTGFRNTLNNDNNTLANSAAPMFSIWNSSKYPATTIKAMVFINKEASQLFI